MASLTTSGAFLPSSSDTTGFSPAHLSSPSSYYPQSPRYPSNDSINIYESKLPYYNPTSSNYSTTGGRQDSASPYYSSKSPGCSSSSPGYSTYGPSSKYSRQSSSYFSIQSIIQ
ncbi:unnamed protein product [Rotaria socialis]|uniref:Uncharacterized protein n=1 Tax=Rotaria socialis TaxID=392032 RepID=A0A818T7H6_9BILA|nr:unnamed protein product [Rotaria socialis]CAF3754292.1 unnamed protein product [Rotaria socialis]